MFDIASLEVIGNIHELIERYDGWYIDAEFGIAVINASDLGVGTKSLLKSLFNAIETADVETKRGKWKLFWAI